MYGIWYIAFGIMAISLTVLALWGARKIKMRRLEKLINNINKLEAKKKLIELEYAQVNGGWFNQEGLRANKEWKELNIKITELKKKKDALKWADADTVEVPLAIGFGGLAVILIAISIFFPLEAKRQANYFKAQKEYVEMVVANGGDVENLAITQEIIKQNEWLMKAKASQAAFGCFSIYCNVDLSELEPITIPKK